VALLLTLAGALTWTGSASCGSPFFGNPLTRDEPSATTRAPSSEVSKAAGTVSPAHSTTAPEPIQRPPVDTSTVTGQASGGSAPGNASDPLPPPPGTVGVPVRLSEPAALRLVRVRDRVDLFRPSDSTHPIASAALVLGVTNTDDPLAGGLLLALPPDAAKAAVEQPAEGFAVIVHPRV
jgi:hypothetical protein